MAAYWDLEPIDLDRRIDEMSRVEFTKFEAGHQGLVVQNVCRTCALEMLRQEILEVFGLGEPLSWEEVRSQLDSWLLYSTASLVQSRAAEQRGDLLKCSLCHKPDGRPAWEPPLLRDAK
jgi:hypothetical protein